jgi:hypothetical protein
MPVPRDISDHNLSAIEATIRATARGRAFLAGYARRVRRSDTMTLLAMLNRLEQLCRDQAVRIAELDGSRSVIATDGALVAEWQSVADNRRTQNVPERSNSLQSGDYSEGIDIIESEDRHIKQEAPFGFSNREAMRRLEELTAAIGDLDRRTADLVARFDESIRSSTAPVTGHLVQDDRERCGTIASLERPPIDQKPPTHDTNILDKIAKALNGTA